MADELFVPADWAGPDGLTAAQFRLEPLHRRHVSGGEVYFFGAGFSGGTVYFGGANFSGGVVDFSDALDWSVPPVFFWTDTPPTGVELPRSKINPRLSG